MRTVGGCDSDRHPDLLLRCLHRDSLEEGSRLSLGHILHVLLRHSVRPSGRRQLGAMGIHRADWLYLGQVSMGESDDDLPHNHRSTTGNFPAWILDRQLFRTRAVLLAASQCLLHREESVEPVIATSPTATPGTPVTSSRKS